ncbi:hypothetical protein TEP_15735 [Stenotrophomonas sp. TEPEL]|nr:hypothetical protein TEP_15735 [Stenotrophomonas sp. TEPEL]
MSTLVDTIEPRHAWMLFVQLSKYSISLEIHPRMAWIYHRHRETVEGGAVWGCRAVGAMDGAIEPPWMGLRRVLQPHTVGVRGRRKYVPVGLAAASMRLTPRTPTPPHL